jgi:hypothetical protein
MSNPIFSMLHEVRKEISEKLKIPNNVQTSSIAGHIYREVKEQIPNSSVEDKKKLMLELMNKDIDKYVKLAQQAKEEKLKKSENDDEKTKVNKKSKNVKTEKKAKQKDDKVEKNTKQKDDKVD